MNFNERFNYLIDNLANGNRREFSQATKIPYSTVTEYANSLKKDPKYSMLKKIITCYNNVNAFWLLTGEGEVFNAHLNAHLDAHLNEKNYGQNDIEEGKLNEEGSKYYNGNNCTECFDKQKQIEFLDHHITALNYRINELMEDKKCFKEIIETLKDQLNRHTHDKSKRNIA